jgi:hypothetical protein
MPARPITLAALLTHACALLLERYGCLHVAGHDVHHAYVLPPQLLRRSSTGVDGMISTLLRVASAIAGPRRPGRELGGAGLQGPAS